MTQTRKKIYEIERKSCKRIIQREKRNFLNGILQEAEKDRSQGSIRNFFRTIRQYKSFNPSLKAIKNRDGEIIMEPELKVIRWEEYFKELLNAEVPVNPTVGTIFQRAEPMLNEITQEETDKAITSLKNWKAPGSDSIPSELIKYGGKQLHYALFKICQKIWRDEHMPTSWNEAIIIPLYKKGDKTVCENYRGISLLNSAYKIFSKILLNRLEPYVEENLGEYQCGFRKGRSTIEQLSVIGQIIEKKYEYRQNFWQLFIDFKKAYDSIHRESLYNIMDEVGIPKKLIGLTKMCMENTQYQIRVDNTLSEAFEVNSGLKQGDALSPLLFNLALEKTIREMQKEPTGITIGERKMQVLGFADDLNILGSSLNDTKRAAQVLEQAAGKVGLKINKEKTKIMKLLENEENEENTDDDDEAVSYEKVNEFQYLGAMLSVRNDWSREIGIRITKAERAAFALNKFLKSKLFSKKTKIRLYTTIIRPTLTYGCEAWTTTSNTERRLRTFENKIWRIICGPVYDNRAGAWRRKFNRELQDELELAPVTSFISGQRIQWLGHVMRRNEEETVRTVLEWKPTGKRPRGRPRKRWLDTVEEDLKKIGVQEWRTIVHNREEWRKIVMAAKTLQE